MVPARRGHGAQLSPVNPLFQRGIADSEPEGGISGLERHGIRLYMIYYVIYIRLKATPRPVFFTDSPDRGSHADERRPSLDNRLGGDAACRVSEQSFCFAPGVTKITSGTPGSLYHIAGCAGLLKSRKFPDGPQSLTL